MVHNETASTQDGTVKTVERRLNDRHYKELTEARGLLVEWVSANCWSVTAKQASELLCYEAKSDGLMLQGNGSQVQFKPDKPWKSEEDKKAPNKKAPKYRTPSDDYYDAILPSHPTDKRYWHDLEALKKKCWQINGKPYILITEGVFKAIVGCSKGIPTLALLGVEMGLTSKKADLQGKRYLVPTLERLAKAGFNFIFAFDADVATKPGVKSAERKLGHQLKLFSDVLTITGKWCEEEGKGMDDFIQKNGIEEFRKRLEGAYWASEEDNSSTESSANSKSRGSKVRENAEQIEAILGADLQWNELKRVVEYQRKELEADSLRLFIAQQCDVDVTESDATAILGNIAKKNSYHPIRDYLDTVYTENKDNLISLDGIAEKLFGSDKPIHQIYFIRHLVGSVARIYKPGCKYDTALLLQGKQGVRKSTFFAELYHRDKDWFLEDLSSETAQGKDQLLNLHGVWSAEYSEIETTFTKKELSALKAFLALCFDTFREPYARREKRFNRQFVFCGSTNKPEFLGDETGNRRFMVIPVTVSAINTGWVRENCDKLWATAVHLYRNGERCHLSKAEMAMQAEDNSNYEVHDTWEDIIAPLLACQLSLPDPFIKTRDILHKIGFGDTQITKREEIRVGGIVQRLGWKSHRRTEAKMKIRGWIPDGEKNDEGKTSLNGLASIDQLSRDSAITDQTETIGDHLNLETFANSFEDIEGEKKETEKSCSNQMVSNGLDNSSESETLVQQPIEVRPLSPQKNQWGRIQDMGADTSKLVCVVEPVDENGNMLVSEEKSPEFKMPGVPFFGTLNLTEFVALTQVECLALGLRWVGCNSRQSTLA